MGQMGQMFGSEEKDDFRLVGCSIGSYVVDRTDV